MNEIKKFGDHYEITVTTRPFFFWKKVRTYGGSGTVWYCRETRKRANVFQEEKLSTIIALLEMDGQNYSQ